MDGEGVTQGAALSARDLKNESDEGRFPFFVKGRNLSGTAVDFGVTRLKESETGGFLLFI